MGGGVSELPAEQRALHRAALHPERSHRGRLLDKTRRPRRR